MDLAQFWFQAPAGGGYAVGNALRFRGGNAYLTRNQTAGNRRTYTMSAWFKLGNPKSGHMILFQAGNSSSSYQRWRITTPDHGFSCVSDWSGTSYQQGELISKRKFRDYSAWYHFVARVDTTQGSASNRVRLYVNGQLIDAGESNSQPGQNAEGLFCENGQQFNFGRLSPGSSTGENLDGYVAEAHFIDGQALAPTDFGDFNTDGVWVPKKVSGVTYGTNGFYLDFSDAADIGADRSGNGNDFTPTGFELTTTTSTSYDWMADSPTNNYATGNPLLKEATGDDFWKEANLRRGAATVMTSTYTIEVPKGCKVYLESSAEIGQGVYAPRRADISSQFTTSASNFYGVNDTGDKFLAGARSSYMPSFGSTDVLGMWIDRTNNTLGFVDKNGTLQGSIGTLPDVDVWQIALAFRSGDAYFNSGTRPFKYTVPTGFEPLSTAGLSAVAITNPSEHFTTILDSGANILTNAQATFPTGLWWIKDRANSNQYQWVDSVRGPTKAFTHPAVNAEQTYVAPSGNSVAWCWNLLADRSNGFDIVSYTGNGSTQTVAHNLGAPPDWIFVASRNDSSGRIYTGSTYGGNWTKKGNLNSDAKWDTSAAWNYAIPTSTHFPVGNSAVANGSGINYVAYLFRNIPGYCSIGNYKGNGNSDGPFVYTGFRPAFIMIKCYSTLGEWQIVDTARSPYNPTQNNQTLEPQDTSSENGFTSRYWNGDILSNGWKYRGSQQYNASGRDYVYIAFAEHCFGGSNVSPAPAR